jgi:hypothetical protein
MFEVLLEIAWKLMPSDITNVATLTAATLTHDNEEALFEVFIWITTLVVEGMCQKPAGTATPVVEPVPV